MGNGGMIDDDALRGVFFSTADVGVLLCSTTTTTLCIYASRDATAYYILYSN